MKTVVCVVVLFACVAAAQTTINVPADQPTIQAGIDAAQNGDTVMVAPGTYFENINFHGKSITVTSDNNPDETIIDGGQLDPVVTFASGEGRGAILKQFTLTHGLAGAGNLSGQLSGGGITICCGSSPIIAANKIVDNTACSSGGGIFTTGSAPLIRGNVMARNSQQGCAGGGGAGIASDSGTGLQIFGNAIVNNLASGNGGGIMINGTGVTLVQNNLVRGNVLLGVAPTRGGGIYSSGTYSLIMLQNVIGDNLADQGGGVYMNIGTGITQLLVNNTMANNDATEQGSALYIAGRTNNGTLVNNLLVGRPTETAVFCDPTITNVSPQFRTNDGFSYGGGLGYDGNCANVAGINGNISSDPLISGVENDDFRLRPGSPAMDTGTNAAPRLPPTDFQGKVRIYDGTGDGTRIVDMGAYEFEPPN